MSAPGEPATWRAAPRLRRLAVAGVVAVIAAVATRQGVLLILAAPALAVLAAAGRPHGPAAPAPSVTVSTSRCFEGEDIEVAVTVPAPAGEARLQLAPGPSFELRGSAAAKVVVAEGAARAAWTLRPVVWGRRVPAVVTVSRLRAGVWQADHVVRAGAVEVFPHPPPARAALLPPVLVRRIGEHTGRAAGSGVEFADVRDYLPGDRLRDVNWSASSRRGRLHVNQRAADRAADLVLVVDTFSEVGPAGATSLDLSVRGAAGLADAYLRAGDRVGVVALGGMLRWLTPAPGRLHYYRIAQMVLDVRNDSVVAPDLDRIPRAALPPGVLAVMFTPLLDTRAVAAATDLRGRGVSLVVVDVLRHEPPIDRRDRLSQLAVRLWRLERGELRASLARLGVPVLAWQNESGLDATLAPLHGRPLTGART